MTKHYPALDTCVFDRESPFRRLPCDLDPTQRRFLEAIRFAMEMAQLSYRRLRKTLTQISASESSEVNASGDLTTAAFLDVWSMVDSLHRLRELLLAMPRLSKRGALIQIFLRETTHVEALRNHFQHLKGDLHSAALDAVPVWGTLGWLWVVDASMTRFRAVTMMAGPDVQNLRQLPVPNNRVFHDQLDHISISVEPTYDVNVSEVMRTAIRVARSVEKDLVPAFVTHTALPLVDAILRCDIVVPAQEKIGSPAP